MKTGIELIAEERQEQIEKHGFDVNRDTKYYQNQELIQAALFCIAQRDNMWPISINIHWPLTWDEELKTKIENKDRVNQLRVAGALIAAEIDRLQNS